jgi:ABC-2 type transport system permease protein
MSRTHSWFPILVFAGIALALGLLGASNYWDETTANFLFFAAWCTAIVMLFALAMSLPLRISGSRYRAMLLNVLLAGVAIVIVCLANIAAFRHDVHLDLSREGTNTPPIQFETFVHSLKSDISLIYFYNKADGNALKAKDLLTVASRENQYFHFNAIDLDKEPAKAREFGVQAYNTALLLAADRRVVVQNTVDLVQMAYAAMRTLKEQVDVVCFVTGHGESIPEGPPHFHYSHVETLKGHEVPGAGDVLQGAPDGLDRLQLALTLLGYNVKPIMPATLTAIPQDCAVVAEIGPRGAYPPGEASLLSRYLARGGRLLVMIDPSFPLGSEFGGLLHRVGLTSAQAVVIDPLNHYGTDDDKVAVPYYQPHPITNGLAMTIFPEARPIEVGATPAGITATILANSSKDSYLRPIGPSDTPAADMNGVPRGPANLAVALEGRWPDAEPGDDRRFRLVLVGDTNFAANAFFPYVSNGDFAVGVLRWLADDDARPRLKPPSFSLEQITLTRDQMRHIFIAVELALPMSIGLLGGLVWWRRR